jgi:hypothetical protein
MSNAQINKMIEIKTQQILERNKRRRIKREQQLEVEFNEWRKELWSSLDQDIKDSARQRVLDMILKMSNS